MKTIDSSELYGFFRDFRFALNGETGQENFMQRQGKAYEVYQAAVEYIDRQVAAAQPEQARIIGPNFGFDEAIMKTGDKGLEWSDDSGLSG